MTTTKKNVTFVMPKRFMFASADVAPKVILCHVTLRKMYGGYEIMLFDRNVGSIGCRKKGNTLTVDAIEVNDSVRRRGVCREAVTSLLEAVTSVSTVVVDKVVSLQSFKCFRGALNAVFPNGHGIYIPIRRIMNYQSVPETPMQAVTKDNFVGRGNIVFLTGKVLSARKNSSLTTRRSRATSSSRKTSRASSHST